MPRCCWRVCGRMCWRVNAPKRHQKAWDPDKFIKDDKVGQHSDGNYFGLNDSVSGECCDIIVIWSVRRGWDARGSPPTSWEAWVKDCLVVLQTTPSKGPDSVVRSSWSVLLKFLISSGRALSWSRRKKKLYYQRPEQSPTFGLVRRLPSEKAPKSECIWMEALLICREWITERKGKKDGAHARNWSRTIHRGEQGPRRQPDTICQLGYNQANIPARLLSVNCVHICTRSECIWCCFGAEITSILKGITSPTFAMRTLLWTPMKATKQPSTRHCISGTLSIEAYYH
jgi:hypothetical protein